jgi:hypothetical protein
MKYVLVVCGQQHVAPLNKALKYLKAFSRREIIVVSSRADNIDHNNIIKVNYAEETNNLTASRFTKTNLQNIVKENCVCCYLDNDVYAVDCPDPIFSLFRPPVLFATDHTNKVKQFGYWAVKDKRNFKDEVLKKFNVKIEESWPIWNGGVFLFSPESQQFLNTWHTFTKAVFADEGWFPRDQGALIAAAWKHGLKNHSRLPVSYNWIVKHNEELMQCDEVDFDGLRFTYLNDVKIKLMHFIHKGLKKDAQEMEFVERLWINKRRKVL